MGWAEMVVAIVFLGIVGKIAQSYFSHRSGPAESADTADAQRLRGEVQQLKERIQVLERVITDDRKSDDLDREIERLRDR